MGARVMTDNYADSDVAVAITATSAQAAFPVSNIHHADRRSKVWRSNGYWEIATGSNDIVFRETMGVDLTATVADANYTSTTTFLAAVKTALDAAGASTYTVTQNSTTKKIVITSNLGGGGGIFELRFASSTAMADTLGFAASNISGSASYTADSPRIHTSERLVWDLGLATNPMAFIMVGPRNRAIRLSPTATIKLEANETDVWTGPTFTSTLAYDETAIASIDEDGLSAGPLRYWSLYIRDRENLNGSVEVGAVFLGDYFEPTRGQLNFPLSSNWVDRSTTVYSEGGQALSDRREKTEHLSLSWRLLTTFEKELFDDHFARYGTSVPFFMQLDPALAYSSVASKYIRFVRFDGEPGYSLESANNFSANMIVREEI
jgi:hypothetical protein